MSGPRKINPRAVEKLLLSLGLPVGCRVNPASVGGKNALTVMAALARLRVEDAANFGTTTLELVGYLYEAKRTSAHPLVTERWSRSKGQRALRKIASALAVIETHMSTSRPTVVALRAEFSQIQLDWKALAPLSRWSATLGNDLVARPLLKFFENRFLGYERARAPFLRSCLLLLKLEKPKSEALEPYRLRDMLKRYDAHRLRNETKRRS